MTTSRQPFIPVSEPQIGEAERRYVNEALDGGWVSGEGPFVARFEGAMAQRVGRKQSVAVANGSVALDGVFAALGLEPGDEVILPTFTIISCVTAILRAGAVPVTIDCDPLTWNMRAEDVEPLIGPRTRAILMVHIYGFPVDADPILDLARRHGLWVVEDAAEAIGQTYKGRPCGGLGDISTFSFYSNKNVTTGEGGMILTNDGDLAARCRDLRNLCLSSERRFRHDALGWNWRMSNLQAALGCGQLERLDEVCGTRRRMGARYRTNLAACPAVQLPVDETVYAKNDYWVFGIVLTDVARMTAEALMLRLGEAGIGSRPFFWPMHEQPVLRRQGLFEGIQHPNAERIARRGLYLPSSTALSDDDIDRVSRTVIDLLG